MVILQAQIGVIALHRLERDGIGRCSCNGTPEGLHLGLNTCGLSGNEFDLAIEIGQLDVISRQLATICRQSPSRSLGRHKFFQIGDLPLQDLDLGVFRGQHDQGAGKFIAQRPQLRCFRGARTSVFIDHPGGVMQSYHPVATVAQLSRLSAQLQQPFLRGCLLAPTKLQAVGKRLLIGLLEL